MLEAPILLIFFIASTLWSTLAYLTLRYAGQVQLSVGSALLLPATLLAFLRPIPLPFSWAAPPEPLSRYAALVSAAMLVALVLYHGGTLQALCRAERLQRSMREAEAARNARRGGGGGLVQRDWSML